MLMPQGAFRHCPTGACGFRWFTSHILATDCPHCGRQLDCVPPSQPWPHICQAGHGASHGGPCRPCEVAADAKAREEAKRTAAVADWVDRP